MIVTQEILDDWKKHPEHEIEASARQTSSIDFNCGPDMSQVMKNWDSDIWRNAYKENWENLKEIRKQELEAQKHDKFNVDPEQKIDICREWFCNSWSCYLEKLLGISKNICKEIPKEYPERFKQDVEYSIYCAWWNVAQLNELGAEKYFKNNYKNGSFTTRGSEEDLK